MIRSTLLVWAVCLTGCAHMGSGERTAGAVEELNQVCGVGAKSTSITGSVWLKASSPEASGQFPAEVRIDRDKGFAMEVTNLIGETQAQIQVQDGKYRIVVPGKNGRTEEGESNWGGIPLRWAQHLFLGRFPCPELPLDGSANAKTAVDDALSVEVPVPGGSEEYFFKVKDWGGKKWAESLVWIRKGEKQAKVQFEFSQPDETDSAPLRWKAVSDQGSVDVRWRRRRPQQQQQ